MNTLLDKYLNLDTLLIQVQCQVTPLWYEFGVAAGVPLDTLSKYLNCIPEEGIVEVLDYWLRQGKKNWRDVARVLNEIQLQELAEKILKVYDTGKCCSYNRYQFITIACVVMHAHHATMHSQSREV